MERETAEHRCSEIGHVWVQGCQTCLENKARADERERWGLGWIAAADNVQALAHAEAVAAKLVEVIRVDDLRLRTQKGHTAQARRERDAARAGHQQCSREVHRLTSELDAARAEVERLLDNRRRIDADAATPLVRDLIECQRKLAAARAEVAALREWRDGLGRAFMHADEIRRDGALRALADLRAKVEGLEHDATCSFIPQDGPCDCVRGAVLALIEEAGQ